METRTLSWVYDSRCEKDNWKKKQRGSSKNQGRLWPVEMLEQRMVLSGSGLLPSTGADAPIIDGTFTELGSPLSLVPRAGDANRDGRFDRLDIQQVLSAGKYLTGMPATWSEGDWNHDELFDQFDLVLALQLDDVAPGGPTSSLLRDDGPRDPSVLTGVDADGTGIYIVVMSDEPVVSYDGDLDGLLATKPGKGQKVNPQSAHVRKYDEYLKDTHESTLAAAGVTVEDLIYNYTFALNGFAAHLTELEAAEIAKQSGVVFVEPDSMAFPATDSSPTYIGLDAPGGPWLRGFDGEGIVVGVIDSGIWPEHPSFADDGTFPPPAVNLEDSTDNPACNFGNTAHNPDDAVFDCNNKLIGARAFLDTYSIRVGLGTDEYDSARDDDGHGTHTASTAAGNAGVPASILGIDRGTISGIAPRAQVIAYKALGNLGGFGADLAAAIDQAVSDGVDVINYSVGGGPSLLRADAFSFLFAADAGVFVATSAGNSGPDPGTMGGPGNAPWLTTVGASTQSRFFEAMVTLGNGAVFSGSSITSGIGSTPLVDAAFAGGDLCEQGTLDSTIVAGKIVLCRGPVGRASKSLAVTEAGGVGMILYNDTDDQNLFTDTHWVPTVHIDNTPGLAIKSYIASASQPTAMITPRGTTEWTQAPSLTSFSSRGPNVVGEDIIKPDVTAPGIQILAGNSPTPDPVFVPGELFQAIAGTSMSSPHVAGIFALLKQAHPDWSPAMAKSAVMTTAHQDVRDNDRVSAANPFGMGAGHVDPGGIWTKGSATEPGLVYDAGFLEYLGFLCDAAPEALVNPAALCAALVSIGIPTDASDLNVPSIGVADLVGRQTVTRTVTSVARDNGWREYSVSVDAPAGFEVEVVPSKLRLKSGDSATYQVNITNTGAPIGEWSFGSLTWHDKTGHYDVYSPIAVRADKFAAPELASGTGTEGSLSFDVDFGYTGDYIAAAHGLEPASVETARVLQDPDRSFSPGDDLAARTAVLHQFSLSGAAVFRVALPPESTEEGADLDVFVFDPSGSLVASSTNPFTDELIDIRLPSDGVWSVIVHGWEAPTGDSVYDLYSWIVSATPGGSLVIDSAPSSATNATTGTIDVSWSGLDVDKRYLGAVSHSDAEGLMALTLIDVTTS